ncbi:MAG TPA: metalloprotease family protein [Sedimentisphaerales bacterium]|nr:metalloprotease family protein [Sedimentisphaerales bacterium]
MREPGTTLLKTGAKIAEIRPNQRAVYLTVFAAGIPAMLSLLALADAWGSGRHDFGLLNLPIALALFMPLSVVHELLHAAAALAFGRVRLRDLSLRVNWKAGALACHVRVPVPVRAARIIGLAPLAVTGPAMAGLLVWRPSQVTALLAGLAILGCAMDVVMVYSLRRFGGSLWVVDHPSEPGFDIVESQHE